ncbi:hypothetical protein [Streptomonospora wellingtoniae]|uniref:Uncharacterized protein n=1 Tax=Streptomonospora wellingtoniae TaxID=3075544 RepID=A0ABU2KZS4_9ACTN|nr:hypothetical protein [Streptomonospora sp. DSM 45055]MDT0304804.1 hypothetical protein [Streptomonospora sp. DSM 45055]
MHYHGYFWRGSDDDRSRRARDAHIDGPRFATADVPPAKMCWWLRKPADMVAGTWDDPAGAAKWMLAQYERVSREIEDAAAHWTPGDRRYAAALRDIADGRDVTWQYQVGGDERAFVSVVACSPNEWDREAPCPLDGASG